MSLPRTVADVLREHVTLELECIDRLYLNVYQPNLQTERKVYGFLRQQHGAGAVSARHFQAMTKAFVENIEAFSKREGIPLITFERHTRKEELAAEYRASFPGSEGILFIGKSQEKVRTFRTVGRRDPTTGASYPWLVPATAMANQYRLQEKSQRHRQTGAPAEQQSQKTIEQEMYGCRPEPKMN